MPTHPQTSTNIYADDTVTLATFKNHKTITLALNNHLYLLQNFFDKWKIKINVDKTVAVLFTRRKTPPTPPTLYSTQLQWSQTTKYLGLILDKKLTWKQHLTHKRDKFRKALRALYPLIGWNSELNMYNKILLYTAVLRPILTYGSPVWGYAADSNIKTSRLLRTRLFVISLKQIATLIIPKHFLLLSRSLAGRGKLTPASFHPSLLQSRNLAAFKLDGVFPHPANLPVNMNLSENESDEYAMNERRSPSPPLLPSLV
ncbi:RNA-directed DNA polymerase from mobile element jockey [Trichonephila clavipes]|nr:RNA-directed DNA polymerase from mobile element jockey [Trichonephila clavipes]